MDMIFKDIMNCEVDVAHDRAFVRVALLTLISELLLLDSFSKTDLMFSENANRFIFHGPTRKSGIFISGLRPSILSRKN